MISLSFWKSKESLWIRWALLAAPAILTAVSLVAAGRNPKPADGPAARLADVPRSARSLPNPFKGNPRAAAAGHKLFERHCAQCHGMDARGIGSAANLRSPGIQDTPPGSLFWVLRNGRIRRGMPSWSQLPDQQLWQMVTYLKTLKKSHRD
ncbi:MAG TPA: c-type cytochrome [Terriglobia bacterium]|nr:c-type cytochrome [Terriglobia bacterium]